MWKRCSAHMKNIKPFIPNNGSLRRLFRAAILLWLIGGIAACFAGCGSSGTPDATATPIAIPEATVTPLPAQGGTLLLPISLNPFTLEEGVLEQVAPLAVNTEEMRNFYSLIYEPLLRCDAANRLTTSLAERWSCDDTGLVWTLQLRQGVRWHAGNGTLSADDVVYTIEQIRLLGEKSYYYTELEQSVLSCEKVDELTVRVTMKQKGLCNLYALTFPILCAQGGSSIEGLPLNGTGPYIAQRFGGVVGQAYVDLEANQTWWKQSPYITEIRCLARESNSVALDSYEAGLLNFVPTDSISAGKYREAEVTNTLDVTTQDAEVLLVNHQNSILSNSKIRQAIIYALDRSAIISNVYMNHATVSDVPVPPDSFLYSASSKRFDYDKAAAEALLAQEGWEDLDGDGVREKNGRKLQLTLLVNDSMESTNRKNAAALVETQLEQAGFDIVVVSARYTLNSTETEFETKLVNREFDLALAGFQVGRNGDLSPYLSAGGSRNYGGYTSQNLNALMSAAAQAGDETAMRETHGKLQEAFVEELPFIMLYFRLNSLVYSTQIQGVAEVREPDILRTVERWYMETDG